MSWITLNKFKTETNIRIDDATVQTALNFSQKQIVRKLFISKRYEYASSTTRHELITPIADQDCDGVIGNTDVDAWEEDSNYNEYDLNSNITNIYNNRRKSYVEFDTTLPTTNRKLYIDYKIAKDDIDKMIIELAELQKLLTIDYLFTNVPFSKLQRGITNWNINGVSVSFDQDAMIKAKEENKKREKVLFDSLRIVRADGIAVGRRFHDNLDRYKHGVLFK
jgi:hypothetical protein